MVPQGHCLQKTKNEIVEPQGSSEHASPVLLVNAASETEHTKHSASPARRSYQAALPATGRATEPAAVRLDQVDPGPEDQHHSNQHAVQLRFPMMNIHRRIAGIP